MPSTPNRLNVTQGAILPRDVDTMTRSRLRAVALALHSYGYDVVLEQRGPEAPKWKVGDVVVLKFPGNPTPYTYVHDGRHFPGKTVHRSNADMTAAWRDGKATLLVRDGKPYADVPAPERKFLPFASPRLYAWREW